jgi:hypothetical protein
MRGGVKRYLVERGRGDLDDGITFEQDLKWWERERVVNHVVGRALDRNIVILWCGMMSDTTRPRTDEAHARTQAEEEEGMVAYW